MEELTEAVFNKTKLLNKRGIYLVANLKSEALCANLIYSIRKSGCLLPIRLIPFGGPPVQSNFIIEQVEVVDMTKLPKEAHLFINELQEVLVDCPRGFLLRFLAWFGDWDEFLYSDNDIVALCNWDLLFDYLSDVDLVHADEEYITHGKFNYKNPAAIETQFGQCSLESAFTAGHFVVRRDQRLIHDINQAINWFRAHPDIPKKHDQSLLHVASLIGKWNILNLCKPPHNWLSSWAGDYPNTLGLIHTLQKHSPGYNKRRISHIHYSGRTPSGTQPIDELIFSQSDPQYRLRSLIFHGCMELSGLSYLLSKKRRLATLIRRYLKK